MQQFREQTLIFNGVAAAASTVPQLVKDWMHIFLTFGSTGSANYTMKFQISYQYIAPDFSAAASPTNQWTYVQVKELITNAAIDGATGITAAGADSVRNFEVNTNGAMRFGATITAQSAGAVTLGIAGKNNG